MNGFIKKIEKIIFGLMSPQDIRTMSTVIVETPDTFEDDGFPIEKGLMDPRMGVLDSKLVCRTCGFRGGDCQGHFGSIELARPVIHIGFAETIYKILCSTCNECGRILLDNEKIEYYMERIKNAMENRESLDNIFDEVYNSINRRVENFPVDDGTFDTKNYCPHCGAHKEPIYFTKPITFRQGYYRLTPSDVWERLEKISDEDSFVLGINPDVARPEWMVLTVLPVPPVTSRPSIIFPNGERLENDLTLKLREILRINQRLLENMEAGAPNFIIEDLWELLQYHVMTYFNNRVEGVPPSKNRLKQPLNTLIQQINDSFNYRVLNKPINFVASSIVSPDSAISINEVGIPRNIAKEITVPVHVNEWNIDEMTYYIKNGPNNFPGANYVIRNDGRKIRIRNEETIELILEQLEPGFIIERHLNNSDVVLVTNPNNKFKNFMMAHEVRVLPYDTIRLNPSVCPAYDVNFDGSVVNIHILQNDESKAEAKSLLKIQENIITPSIGGPIVGGFDDYILGMFLLTRIGVEFSQEEVFQIMRKLNLKMPKFNSNQIIYKFDLDYNDESFIFKDYGANLTGKELFSLLLPNDLNLLYESSFSKFMSISENEDAFVVIEDGILKQGVIDKQSFGLVVGKILNTIAKDYESDKVRFFIDAISKLGLYSASKFGITTSLNDYDVPHNIEIKIDEIINEKLSDFDNSYNYDTLLKDISESIFEILQNYYKTQYSSNKLNFNSLMVNTQANLNIDEINSISACVGQQSLNHEKSYNKRVLPHFKKNNYSENRGFIKSSYLNGLTPAEYFMNAINHRANKVNKELAIYQSGNLMKYLSNVLQDLQVKSSGLVINNQGKVIQTIYGEDNVDPAKSDFGRVVDLDRLIDDIRVKNDKENLNSDNSEYDIYRNTFKNLKNILNDLKNMSRSILSLEVESIGLEDLNEAINSIIPLITNVLESDNENEILENYESFEESYNIFKSIYDEEMEKIQDDLLELQNKKELAKLKNKIKICLNDFYKLKSKIINSNLDTDVINEIKYEVESQIRLLELIMDSNSAEELSEVINDSNDVYINLSSKFDEVIYEIKLNDLKLELGGYLPKVYELNDALINANIADIKKNKYSFDIDSLILAINDSQNFDNVDKLSLSLINIKNSYNSLKSKIPHDFSNEINDGVYHEISVDLDEVKDSVYDEISVDLDEVKDSVYDEISVDLDEVKDSVYDEISVDLDEVKDSVYDEISVDLDEVKDSVYDEISVDLDEILSKFLKLEKEIDNVGLDVLVLNIVKADIYSNIKLLENSQNLKSKELSELILDCEESYISIIKTINAKDFKKSNYLKDELRYFLSKFENLESSLPDENAHNFVVLREDINSNIQIIKSSLRLRKIEKLEKKLDSIRKNYYYLENQVNVELINFSKMVDKKKIKSMLKVYLTRFKEYKKEIPDNYGSFNFDSLRIEIDNNIKKINHSLKLVNTGSLNDSLNEVKMNYYSFNDKFQVELEKFDDYRDDLKNELLDYIPKFEELDKKISVVNVNTPKLKSIQRNIESNIKVLKKSNQLKRIETIENKLNLIKKNYYDLNKRIDIELTNIENDKIKTNDLKVELKNYLYLFEELDDKANATNGNTTKLKNIKKEIKSNIKLLKSSSRLKKIDKLEDRLYFAKKSYDKVNSELDLELKNIDNNNHVKELKIQLKEFIPKFIELNEKISDVNVNSSELKSICNDIESNIDLLKYSSRLRNLEKIETRLSDAKRNYDELNKQVDVELKKIEATNLTNDLKLELKNYLILFEKLDEKSNSANENTPKLKSIKRGIKSNIKLLKSSSRLKKIDKLKNRLSIVEKSFKDLNHDLESELKNIENNNKIKLKYQFNESLLKFNKLNDEINSLYVINDKLDDLSNEIAGNIEKIEYTINLDELNSMEHTSNFDDFEIIKGRLNSINNNYDKIERKLIEFKNSYYPINVKISYTGRVKSYPNSNKFLKMKIKELLSDYFNLENCHVLKHRVISSNLSASEINNFIKTIDLNVELLNKALRFRKIEKIKNSLNVATKNYMVIHYKIYGEVPPESRSNINHDKKVSTKSRRTKKVSNSKKKVEQQSNIPNIISNSLNNIEIRNLINENSSRIINLRKKYYNQPSAIQQLSGISSLNIKLNSKFKRGKDIKLDDILDVKNRLDQFEKDFKSISVSSNSKKYKSNSNVKKSKNVNSIEKPKKSLTQPNYSTNRINTLQIKSNNQLDDYKLLKNKMDNLFLENKDCQKIIDLNNNFNSYFNAVKKLNDDIYEYKLNFNGSFDKTGRYNQLNINLNEYSKKFAEFEGKIKIFKENKYVLKNKLKCDNLLNKINEIIKLEDNNLNSVKKVLKEYSNELIILKKYFLTLENNILSYNLKTVSNGKYGQNISIRLNEIDKDLENLIKKYSIVFPKDLLSYLYSLTGHYGIISSFRTNFSADELSDSDVKNIRSKIKEEINSFKLKTSDDVDLRLDELIKEKLADKNGDLFKYLDSINCVSKFNLSVDECEEIKNNIRAEINLNIIRDTMQLDSKFNKFVKIKLDNRSRLLDYLYDIIGEYGIKESFISYLNKNNISLKEGKEIRDKVKTEINEGKFKTSDDIQLRIDNLIKQKQSDKTNELLDYLYSIMGQYGVKSSFRIKFKVDELSEGDINEIRVNLKNEIKSNDLKSEEELDLRISKLIDQKKNEKYDELFEELYKTVGENNISEGFVTRLSDNHLSEVNGNYIKQVIEDEIKNQTIINKSKINIEIYNLIKKERERQNNAIYKLNEFFINNNAHLIGLSSEDKDEIKSTVEKSIKENRLSERAVYEEFKNTINEFKQNKNDDDFKPKEDDDRLEEESKSSGGLMSRLKRLFS